jgi:TetR/AcrR family transcriptional regulator, copper-responsive repressor
MSNLPAEISATVAAAASVTTAATAGNTRGRQLSFNRQEALRKAAHLFWKNGFSPTSLSELTSAMGIHPPSLYNAFGGKENLFREVLDDYLAKSNPWLEATFTKHASVRDALEVLAHDMAVFLTDTQHPPGCLLSCGGVNLDAEHAELARTLKQMRRRREAMLVCKLKQARQSGELPKHLSPRRFADYVMTVQQGMSAMARDGATRQQLLAVAHLALGVWPGGDAGKQGQVAKAKKTGGRA